MSVFAFNGIADSWPHLWNWNQALEELLCCAPLSTALQKYLDSICTFPVCSGIIRVMFPISGKKNGQAGWWGQNEESDLTVPCEKSGGNGARKHGWNEPGQINRCTRTNTLSNGANCDKLPVGRRKRKSDLAVFPGNGLQTLSFSNSTLPTWAEGKNETAECEEKAEEGGKEWRGHPH